MKRKIWKKMICAVLGIIMTFCLIPTSVFAQDTVILDGTPTALDDGTGYELKLSNGNIIRFYNVLDVDQSIAAMDKSEYIRRCLETAIPQYSSNPEISLPSGVSPANLWLYLGIVAQDQFGTGTATEKFKTQFDNVLSEYITTIKNLGTTESISNGDNTYNVSTSGLQHAASLKKADDAIKDKLFEYYDDANGTRDEDDAVSSSSQLNDTKTQDVYWTLISANKTSGTFKKGHYQAVAVIFSDFTLSPLFASDVGNTYTVHYLDSSGNEIAQENAKTTKDLSSVAVTNASSEAATLTKTVSATSTITTTSEVNGTQEYSFGQSIGAGINIGTVSKIQINLNFSQAISDGWSKTNSTENSVTQETGIEVTALAYTAALISSKEESLTTRITYDCPLAVGYKVTIVEYTLDPTNNKAEAQSRVLATYGTDSRTTLYQSVMQGKGTDNIEWSKDTYAKAIAQKLATTMPCSTSGASVTSTSKVTTFQVHDFSPYYPLSTVKSTNTYSDSTDGRLPVGIGGRFCVDNIALEGYNAQGGLYYGFQQSAGEWLLLDSTGAEIGKGDENTPAKLYTDVDGKVYLQGQSVGEVYLKYIIQEDVYNSFLFPNQYATNDGITTAVIPVKIVDSVSVCTPTYMEQQDSYTVESTKEDLMKDLHSNAVLSNFGDECANGIGVVEYIAYMSEDEAQGHFGGIVLTQDMIDNEMLGKTFFVRSVVNNHFSQYVEIKLVSKPKSDTVYTYGEKIIYSESESDNRIVIEDSVMEPASPVGTPDCNGPHTGGTATCTEKAVCSDCGQAYGEPLGHKDDNNDGKCDTCEYNVGTTTTDPDDTNKPDDTTKPEDTNKPFDDVQSPQTGDTSNLCLWVALLFISGGAVITLTVVDRKKRMASKR